MSEDNKFKCEDCGLRKKYDLNPRSLIGRLWKWHTRWCPGWKAYQKALAESGGGDRPLA